MPTPRLNPERPQTPSERQQRARQANVRRLAEMREALTRIAEAEALDEARRLADEALERTW
jgi:hypothetical protein